jgi:hypothetical protein
VVKLQKNNNNADLQKSSLIQHRAIKEKPGKLKIKHIEEP